MSGLTLQTARNLEKFCLEQIHKAGRLAVDFAELGKATTGLLWLYRREVERRKSEALKWEGATDRRKTPRVTNINEHLTEVREETP